MTSLVILLLFAFIQNVTEKDKEKGEIVRGNELYGQREREMEKKEYESQRKRVRVSTIRERIRLQCIMGQSHLPQSSEGQLMSRALSDLIKSSSHPALLFTEDKMLAENIPIPSSPVPIATIDLMPNSEVMTQSVQQEPTRPARKTRHQEEQEDGSKPTWALSVSPWVTIAFAIVQIRELIIMRKTQTHTEVQPLQVAQGIMGNNTRNV